MISELISASIPTLNRTRPSHAPPRHHLPRLVFPVFSTGFHTLVFSLGSPPPLQIVDQLVLSVRPQLPPPHAPLLRPAAAAHAPPATPSRRRQPLPPPKSPPLPHGYGTRRSKISPPLPRAVHSTRDGFPVLKLGDGRFLSLPCACCQFCRELPFRPSSATAVASYAPIPRLHRGGRGAVPPGHYLGRLGWARAQLRIRNFASGLDDLCKFWG